MADNIDIDFTPDLAVTGKGVMYDSEKMFKGLSFAQSLPKTIALYQLIDQAYKNAVSGDGRIVGGERGDIMAKVDQFFNALILMWTKMDEGEETKILVENKNVNFLLEITAKDGVWHANGRLAPFFCKPVKNFADIYNQKLAPEIVSLLKRYAEAVQDGVIDEQETADLQAGMQRVLYYSLFLRMQLEQCFINA